MSNALIKSVLTLAVLVAAFAAAAGILMTRPSPEKMIPSESISAIRAVIVSQEPLTLWVKSQGTIAPQQTTELIPEVSGRVQWMSPNLVAGGYFKAGEVMLEIDPVDYESRAGLAEAKLIRAEADLEHSLFELERMQALVKNNLISQASLQTATRTHKIATAAHIEAGINQEQALRDLSRTKILAPFDGLIAMERVDLGQFLQQGAVIATLYGSDQLEVRLPIVNEQLAYLDLPEQNGNQPSEDRSPTILLTALFAGKQHTWRGTFSRTEAEINAQSRMVTAVARIDQNEQPIGTPPLQIGLFVSASIEGRTVKNVMRLPRAALRSNDQVLVIDEDDRIRFRTVNILRVDSEEVIIDGGLVPGERVNVSPIQTVVDGMRVATNTEWVERG
jgi:RND family efflux transporter MFP subunit